ncbi:MAG TPA: hypothetical protein VK431_04505 [Nitrosopumilaceae archaeon]|nr:hypothetical protein [Nitrosopumilaceae archaeon]
MLKKASFFTIFALLPSALFGMVTDSQSLLNHIRTELHVLKRAWNTARIQIKMAEKSSPVLYQQVKPIFEQITSSTSFTQRINDMVDEQFNAIVNNYMTINQVKTDIKLSDFFPHLTMHSFGQNLFSAMARKYYYLRLAEKLANKIRELQQVIILQSTQPSLQA